ncbi:hypothetical protein Tel_16445 [Candidatus Tenderia electrophaga]|uniref:Porin n=1 Tax=Candidatus Tenderia electrophaga TaxID=1748243 RepID=A0A0S2THH1_9GAMM|nr:hypothetical protein Tel_16445 [Candidatus Tenderia electrophaga]
MAALSSASVLAGVTYKDGDSYVKLGGRIQLQYHKADPDGGQATDDIFFRRLRPYIEGSLHPNWKGKFQWDMGKAEDTNEIAVKDAYMQYKAESGVKVSLGNYSFPFSREYLTSSKYQQLVERTFVGDHNYGTPDRQAGVYVEGMNASKTFDWAVGLADGRIDPDDDKIDFEPAVNNNSDFNQGMMVGGRVSFHPFGYLKMKQGDFSGEQKATVSLGAFSWSNDDDNNTRTSAAGVATDVTRPDLDSVTGLELSGAYRNKGFSVDAQYNIFDAETIDASVTSGLFRNGETELTSFAVEGGYMVIPSTLELVVGLSSQDADNYTTAWDRTEFGANWFVHKHDVKFQLTLRQNENVDGQQGNDLDEVFAQAQYVF